MFLSILARTELNKIKVVFGICLVVIGGWASWYFGYFSYQKTWSEQFCLENIMTKPQIQEKRETVEGRIQDHSFNLLQQTFFYLGQGRQVYAFESEDGAVVLKFFKQQRFEIPYWIQNLSSFVPFNDWKQSTQLKVERRRSRYFTSCKIAYEMIPEETGLLYLQLDSDKSNKTWVDLHDDKGALFQVNLGQTSFFVQKKAQPIQFVIEELMSKNQEDKAKQRVGQIFDLLYTCAKKGILDKDTGIARRNNLGFLQDRCIFIDIGTLKKSNKPITKEDFSYNLERLYPLYEYLKSRYPALAVTFQEEQKAYIDGFDVFYD